MRKSYFFSLIIFSLLPMNNPISIISKVALVLNCIYEVVCVGSTVIIWTTKNSITLTGWLAAKGIEQGGRLLDKVELLRPTGFSFMPMMPMCASAHESHAPTIRSYKQFGASKEGDSDGDGEADNADNEQDQADHAAKSSWERLLIKYAELSARLDKLEVTSYANPNNG